MITINSNCGVQGFYKIHLSKGDKNGNIIDGTTELVAEFENLVTNNGLELMKGNTFCNNCSVGTGSSTPSNTDTTLASHLATKVNRTTLNAGTGNLTVSPRYNEAVMSWTFAQGAVVGNISEVGVGAGTAGTNLFSRALVLDGDGNPTTITVTSIDILTITYVLRLYPSESDSVATINIGGVDYTCTTRLGSLISGTLSFWVASGHPIAGQIGSYYDYLQTYSGALNGVATAPSAQSGAESSTSSTGYGGVGEYWWQAVWSFSIGQGNATGGIQAVATVARVANQWKTGFSPVIPKDNTKTLTITMRYSWGRYTP